ncbi:MAG: pseudoazurin [Pseudomonadota bacterium]
MFKKLVVSLAIAMTAQLPSTAAAEEIIVKMLNRGSDGALMVFEPAFIRAEVGDVVKFVPTNPSHNAESIKGMLPEGAASFKGRINKEVAYEITTEGVYGVKCLPHYGMGMVALIVAGEQTNLEEAKAVRHVGKAKPNFVKLFEQAAAPATE